jgi:hypothetical protein
MFISVFFRNDKQTELTSEDGMGTEVFECKNEIRSKMWSPPPATGYNGLLDLGVFYKYQDPKTYSGPVVPGWEPGKLNKFISSLNTQVETCSFKAKHD